MGDRTASTKSHAAERLHHLPARVDAVLRKRFEPRQQHLDSLCWQWWNLLRLHGAGRVGLRQTITDCDVGTKLGCARVAQGENTMLTAGGLRASGQPACGLGAWGRGGLGQ